MPETAMLGDIDELVGSIERGSMLAIPKDESGAAMEATRAMIRHGIRDLRLLCVPVCGMQADLLIGAGCVAHVECGGIVINEIGVGPRFRAAVSEGTIVLRDSTCPAIHAALQAGEKGQPFAAVRGILGSDLLHHRDDWRVVDNPFGDANDRVVLVPAINPDVFLFHAAWGDRFGNVWIGGRRDLAYTAHAARRTLVTVEDWWDGDLLADERMAAGTLAATYVSAVAHAPRGAWPLTL
ncbi:MAG TPA: CoA-transferase, partial [Casimicrobiaceae bacterium]|nr:CoA-transferase [Casimicrobiaceae bacterium]